MSTTINLKEIEQRAWKSTFQDGLWDIYLGLLLLGMAISGVLSDIGTPKIFYYAIYIGMLVLAMAILWAGKRFISVPRIGTAKFSAKRKTKLNWVRGLLVLSVVVGLIAFGVAVLVKSGYWREWFRPTIFFPAIWVMNALVVFSLGAYILDFKRLYIIGVLYALPVPVDMMLLERTGLDLSFAAFGVPALAILIMGTVVLIRFLRDYPVPEEEHSEEGVHSDGV